MKIVLSSIFLFTYVSASNECPVGKISLTPNTTKSFLNTIKYQKCETKSDVCLNCCSYTYFINTSKFGSEQRCIAWYGENCQMETPVSTDFEFIVYDCNPSEEETCYACNLDQIEPLQVSKALRHRLPTTKYNQKMIFVFWVTMFEVMFWLY